MKPPYYLDYRNKRPAYLENFFDKLINFIFNYRFTSTKNSGVPLTNH